MQQSTTPTATRLARVDATIFGVVLLLGIAIADWLPPEATWAPFEPDLHLIFVVALSALVGSLIVFWRVRAAYAGGPVSIWKAAGEGLLCVVVFVLALIALEFLDNGFRFNDVFASWRGWGAGDIVNRYVRHMLQGLPVGAMAGAAFYGVNRLLVLRTSTLPSP